MQPEQQPANYDFIMNPDQPKRHSPIGGNSMATRILVVVGGLSIVVIILVVAMRLLSGAGIDKAAYVEIAQKQAEIIRLSDSGVQNGVSQTVRNFAITAKLGMRSEQKAYLTYLQSEGVGPSDKELALNMSAKTDTQLANAKSASNFDPVYTSVMKQQLEAYMADLSQVYEAAEGSARPQLAARYDAAELLLTQLTGKKPE